MVLLRKRSGYGEGEAIEELQPGVREEAMDGDWENGQCWCGGHRVIEQGIRHSWVGGGLAIMSKEEMLGNEEMTLMGVFFFQERKLGIVNRKREWMSGH